MKTKNYEMDMTSGSLVKKVIVFAIPLALSSILQLLFNAADVIVVGRFAGSEALAAVGSTGSLINLLTNLFIGLSIGASVLVSKYYAARDQKSLQESVHTAILVALYGGLLLAVVGNILARLMLEWMGTPEDVIDLATLYLRIYFVGMPATMLYNYGSAILRAVGDTKRPLYYLMIAGALNVVLNLFFVIVCDMSVAGVALATVLSQCVSAALIILCLIRSQGAVRLERRYLKIHGDRMKEILQTGLPAGIQGSVFSISNVLIQSSINSFGSVVMAGSAAAANIEGFVYVAMNAFYQAAISFTGQNVGGQRYERIGKTLLVCEGYVIGVGILLSTIALTFATPLLSIYTDDPTVVQYGITRMHYICATYFICGMMDTVVGSLRGMGSSFVPMITSLLGACAFRVIWIFTVFAANRSLETLYISYPISWVLTLTAHLICYHFIRKKYPKRGPELTA